MTKYIYFNDLTAAEQIFIILQNFKYDFYLYTTTSMLKYYLKYRIKHNFLRFLILIYKARSVYER